MSCYLCFVIDVAFFNNGYNDLLKVTVIGASLDSSRGLEDSLVSVNGVFVEASN